MANSNNGVRDANNKDMLVGRKAKIIKPVKGGRISIGIGNEPSVDISTDAHTGRFNIDVLNPEPVNLFDSQQDKEKSEEGNKEGKGTFDTIKGKLASVKEAVHILKDDETGLFDKHDTVKEFAQKLTDNDVTLTILRKSKEAIILGRDAKPTVSRVISGSDDLQIKSVKGASKLTGDLLPG